MIEALETSWRFTAELFDSDAVDAAASATGLGPRFADLREPWLVEITAAFDEAGIEVPADSGFRSTGTRGVHSEHMGFILAEMQHLQRSFPGAAW